MLDPRAISLAQIRSEEMRHKADFERSVALYPVRPSLHRRVLSGVGRSLITLGAALENRYGEVKQHAAWRHSNNRMERAL
ncbi:MAG: hypothetical protein R2873_15165 [Caldilineaceae bacterium]|nr:hypothetical protein [Caldilineaceae bacterium]